VTRRTHFLRSLLSARGKRNVLLSLVGWIAPAIYLVLALIKIQYPGLHFDELLHVNAALGGLDSTFVYRSIHLPLIGDVPILLMPYIGALKAYLTAPIFALFGVSVFVIRVPMILLTAFSLRLLHGTVRRSAGPVVASSLVLLLAVDPTLISLTRADSGPVALQFALTVCAIWGLERYRATLRFWALLFTLASLGLGVFNKLNFIWIVDAFLAATVMAYGPALWRSARVRLSRKKFLLHVAATALGVGGTVGYYLLVSSKFNLGKFLDLKQLDVGLRLENIWTSLRGMLDGQLFYDYGLGELTVHGAKALVFVLGAVVAWSLLLCVFSSNARAVVGRQYLFYWLLFLGTLAQIGITRNAVWPWHYATLYPALTVILVLSIKLLAKRIAKIAWLLVPIMAGFYVVTYGHYLQQYGSPTKNVYWSPAIYELIELTRDEAYTYVSLDWGTHTQLLGLSQDPGRFKNASFSMNRSPLPTDARERFEQDFLQGQALGGRPARFILHAANHTLFPAARKNFFELVGGMGAVQPVAIINNGSEPLFEVYQLR